jgi:hypothetical protein
MSRMRRRLALAAALLAVVGLGSVGCESSDAHPAAIQGDVRPATAVEARQAQDALWYQQSDSHHPPRYEVYVAIGDFHTVYSDRAVVVLMHPGVHWLGGALGNTTLVMQVTEEQLAKGRVTAAAWRNAQRFAGASIVYDPICWAHTLGYATEAACKATPAQRAAAEQHSSRMVPMSGGRVNQFLAQGQATTPAGSNVDAQWLEPLGTSVVLPAKVAAPVEANHVRMPVYSSVVENGQSRMSQTGFEYGHVTYLPVVALHAGQMITGGSLGGWDMFLPRLWRVYYEGAKFNLFHYELSDPLRSPRRSGIAFYLGSAVLPQYAG